MAKLILGKAPKTFQKEIIVPLLNGESAEINFTFKFKTRDEYAKLIDKLMAAESPTSTKSKKTVEEKALSLAETFAKVSESTINFILEIAEGWDLDDAFNKSTVAQLMNEFPGSTAAISEGYRQAILEGRVKN